MKYIALFVMLMINSIACAADAVYAQLSSNKDQLTTPDTLNQGIVVNLENLSEISGLDWNSQTNEILIIEDGVYFVMLDMQCGARESAAIIKGGDIYCWFEKNKKPIENGGSWIFVAPHARSKNIVNQTIAFFKKGEALRVKYAATAPSMGLISFPGSEFWPSSPGAALTIYKIGEKKK